MSASTAIAPSATEIRELAARITDDGYELTAAEARSLLEVSAGTEAYTVLLQEACRIREHFLGRELHCCSILNAKAGGCTENCSYCAQASGISNDEYDKHGWMKDEDISVAAESAAENGAQAMGLVAAWRGVKEGKQLDMVCDSIEKLSDGGRLRADVNLGLLESQHVADRLAAAGARVYGHNLETARSFFKETCETHEFDDRMRTIGYVKEAGMGLCSGGIVGMGESKDQRIEFAEQLRFIEPDMIPINFLNPLTGTPYEGRDTVPADEALVTLATLRFFLPERHIMVAGGKEVTFGDRLDEVLDSGIDAIMVGNYLTSLGTGPDFWRDSAAARGMRLQRDVHEADSCSSGSCGCK